MMKRYEEYKESGVSWLGYIPSHWKCKKIDSLFKERSTKVSDKEYKPLSVTKIGIIPQMDNVAKSDAGDNRKLVCDGDFVINSRSDRKGSCGISNLIGSVSLINTVLTPRKNINKDFLHFLLRSIPFSEEYYRNGRGIVSDLWTTRYSEMKSIYLPIPTTKEQKGIVEFLHNKIINIDKCIAVKEEQINALRMLKESYISETVVNKNSKIEHSKDGWSEVKIGKTAYIRSRLGWKGLKASEYVDFGYPFLSAYNIIDNELKWKNLSYINSKRYEESPEIKLKKGDIILVKDGAGIGKCARIDELPYGDSTVNGSLAVITTGDKFYYKFLYYYLTSIHFKNAANRIITGMGVPHLTQHFLKNLTVPLPPLRIQKLIAEELDEQSIKISKMILHKKTEIDKLKELKMSLISDVVIGKINVTDFVI